MTGGNSRSNQRHETCRSRKVFLLPSAIHVLLTPRDVSLLQCLLDQCKHALVTAQAARLLCAAAHTHVYSSLPLKLHMLKPFSIWCMLVTLLAT
jgi:hypothetical protein